MVVGLTLCDAAGGISDIKGAKVFHHEVPTISRGSHFSISELSCCLLLYTYTRLFFCAVFQWGPVTETSGTLSFEAILVEFFGENA